MTVEVGGYNLGRAANGQWQARSVAGGGQLLAAHNGWGLWIMSCDGANSAVTEPSGITTPAPTLVAPTLPGHKYTGIGATGGNVIVDTDIVELVIWPFAMTEAQRTLVRATLKQKYPILP